jgi:hypothetical protein
MDTLTLAGLGEARTGSVLSQRFSFDALTR